MATCYDCGAPCGKRNPTGWRNEHFWCDRCARKHANSAVQLILGIIFLAFSAIVTAIVCCTVFRPLVPSLGYGTVKVLAIGSGVGGVVLFMVLRSVAARTDGCLFRMLVKFVGFLLLALGVGLLITVFLAESTFKASLGVEKEATPEPSTPSSQQPNP